MAEDPDHPLRAKTEEALASLADRLQHDPELQAKVAAWRDAALANPAVGTWLDGLWQSARAAMLRAARDPEAVAAGKFGEAMRQMGQSLQEDARVRIAVNRFARRASRGHRCLLWRSYRHTGFRNRARLGRADHYRSAENAQLAAICNISGSTALWSADW
jgi:hypothetical protein